MTGLVNADLFSDLAAALRDVLAVATTNRDAHSALLAKAGGGTVASRGKEEIVAVESAVIDALDAVLDSDAGIRARRLLDRYEMVRS